MDPSTLHGYATAAEMLLAGVTFVALLFISAPYGRHVRRGWGPSIPARLGWVLMEAPASLGFLAIYQLGDRRGEAVPLVLLALWQFHYAQRAFVYPFRMRMGGKTMPVLVALLAIVFNLLNAYVNARWISHLGVYPEAWLADPRFVVGVVLFAAGWATHTWADARLAALRKPGETGYRIPHGGLYDRIASPNYLGEIVQWIGWAILTWSPAGLAFALYTFANLAPRAGRHRRWYRDTFPDYPPSRKALVPWVW